MSGRGGWGDYRLGIGVVMVLVLIVLAVFMAGSQRGPFLPDTVPYYLELEEAAGIRVGSFVRVGGIFAGEVRNVEIVPPVATIEPEPGTLPAPSTFRPAPNIRIELEVDERFQPHITASSRAQLSNLGLGGERYVSISAGDVREAPTPVGGRIEEVASVDWDIILGKLARVFNEARVLAVTVTEIRTKVLAGSGTATPLLDVESALYDNIQTTIDRGHALIALIDEGPGLIARARADSALGERVAAIRGDVAFLDSLRQVEDSGLARWTAPDSLQAGLARLTSDIADLRQRIDEGDGTLGRMAYDRELQEQLRVLQALIGQLSEAIRENPLGYVEIELF